MSDNTNKMRAYMADASNFKDKRAQIRELLEVCALAQDAAVIIKDIICEDTEFSVDDRREVYYRQNYVIASLANLISTVCYSGGVQKTGEEV